MSTSTPSTAETTPTSQPNISLRSSILYLPHPLPPNTPIPYIPGLPATNPLKLPPHPFEPTSTLVLTSPGRTFVDLRYHLPQTPTSPLPNTGAPHGLAWGFAGASTSVPSGTHAIYGSFTHAKWVHWVDSRCAIGTQPDVDEGDMYTLDAAAGLYLEHGHAWHPDLGRVAGHEEVWQDVQVSQVGQEKGGIVSVVLRWENPSHGRGVVVRVGSYCQGIIVLGDQTTTERWEWDSKTAEDGISDAHVHVDGDAASLMSSDTSKSWKRTARTGDAFLPCAVTFRLDALRLGGTVRYGEFEWTVEELWVG